MCVSEGLAKYEEKWVAFRGRNVDEEVNSENSSRVGRFGAGRILGRVSTR